MPDSLVKSLDSSTRAFAGSQAAQHSVSCLSAACAFPAAAAIANVAAARHDFHIRIKVTSLEWLTRLHHEAGGYAESIDSSSVLHRVRAGLQSLAGCGASALSVELGILYSTKLNMSQCSYLALRYRSAANFWRRILRSVRG